MFHHVLGLTDGVRELARRLAGDTHVVHTPDLYGGRIASTLEDGFELKEEIGDDVLDERVEVAIAECGDELVFAGLSLGVLSAQRLAQSSPAARGALLYEACVPITGEWTFGPWPAGVPVQIHGMDGDEFFAGEGDLDAARGLAASIGPDLGQVFTYAGEDHLFLDSSLPSFDAAATELVVARSRALLDAVG